MGKREKLTRREVYNRFANRGIFLTAHAIKKIQVLYLNHSGMCPSRVIEKLPKIALMTDINRSPYSDMSQFEKVFSEKRKPVYAIDKETGYVRHFTSIYEAGKSFDGKFANIAQALKRFYIANQPGEFSGYFWRYKNEKDIPKK